MCFEVEAEPTSLTDCNCSLCAKKGALYLQIAEVKSFRIVSGEDELREYQFNTGTARHYFCWSCGIHTFHRPRIAPGLWSVNARCLDGLDLGSLPHHSFDGQNWEEAAAAERGGSES